MIAWTSVAVASAEGATIKSKYNDRTSSTSHFISREVWD